MAVEKMPVVMIGVTRGTAIESSEDVFTGSRFYITACLDKTEAPESLRFDEHNLALILYALHPRPRALVTGTAVSEAECARIEPIWNEHVKRIGKPAVWVVLSKTHPTTGPPPPGIGEAMLKQLEDGFLQ